MRPSLRLAGRISAVAILVGFLVWGVDLAELGAALRRISPIALGVGLLVSSLNVGVAVLRWRALMGAFGARFIPAPGELARLFLIGLFYNTYVPGVVGGDVVRGVVSRRCFEEVTASYVVVLGERVLGLLALGPVFAIGLALGPDLVDWRQSAPWLIAIGLAGFGAAGLYLARRTLIRWVGKMPRIVRPSGIAVAFGISLIGHAVTLAVFMLLAVGMDLPISLVALAAVVPLGMVASAIPIAVAGVGPREAALVGLLRILGVSTADALALSLGYAAILLTLAGIGGLVQLFGGRLLVTEPETPSPPPDSAPPA